MNLRLSLNYLIQYRALLTTASTILALKTPVSLSFKVVSVGSVKPEVPPIFCLHDLLGCKRQWKGIAKIIAHITRRTVVVVDIRNHGQSPHIPSNKYSEMAEDLIQLFDKMQVSKASVVGHDIGGRMAMSASLVAPDRIAGLVVLDISPVSTSEHMRGMITVLKAMDAVEFKNPKKVTQAKKEAARQLKQKIHNDQIMNRIMGNIKIKKDGIIGWGCNLEALINNFNQLLVLPRNLLTKEYHGPCLFIGGQLSEYIPADDLTKIREVFPHAVIRYIVNTGHNLHLEDPKSFLEIAMAFLDTHY